MEQVEDYPRTLVELEVRFSSEQACREYLVRLRWPEGFRCTRCGESKVWWLRSGRGQCAGCGHQVSVTAGTIFQGTRTPLTIWFRAMWWMTSQKNGISALGLQRVLGLGSYQTAWVCLHKLRRAMVRPGRERLSGSVEVDETYLGGLEEGMRGRQSENKAVIVVAAEKDGKGICMSIFTMSPSGSTGASRTAKGSCSTVSSSKISLYTPQLTRQLSGPPRRIGSENHNRLGLPERTGYPSTGIRTYEIRSLCSEFRQRAPASPPRHAKARAGDPGFAHAR